MDRLDSAGGGVAFSPAGDIGNPRLIKAFQAASKILVLSVLLLGVSVLIGWFFGIALLKSVFPGSVTMKVNTALGFIFLSAPLWMLQAKRADNLTFRFGSRLCSWVAILIGVLTLLEYLAGWDLGIDQLLIKESPGALFTVHLGRPAFLTALNIILTGLAILTFDSRDWRGIYPSQVLLIVVMATSLLSFQSHLFATHLFFNLVPGSTAMAFHTALGFFALSTAMLLVRSERGVTAILISDTAGGVLVRRMLIPSLIFMIVLDYVTDFIQKAGFYDADSETVIHGTFLLIFFSYIILATAKLLRNADIEKARVINELSESEGKYRQIFQQASDYILVLDPAVKGPPIIVDASDSAFEKHGYTREELLGKPITLLLLDEGKVPKRLLDIKVEKELRFESTHRRKDGSTFLVDISTKMATIVGKEYIFSVERDITERKKAEESIRESEKLLRTVLDLLPMGVWIQDEKGALIQGNKAAQSIWAGNKLIGIDQFGEYKGWWLKSGKLIEPHEWAAARAIEKGETSINEEILIQCFDGSQKIILNSAVPIRKDDGSISGAICVNHDVTALKRAEQELSQFFNLVPDMVCIASTEGYFLKVNPIWEKVLGFNEQELLTIPFTDFIHPDDRESTMSEVARQIGGEATIEFINRYRCKGGGYRWLEWMAIPSPDKKQLVAAARDITDRKEAQEKVVEAKNIAEAATLMKDKFVSLVSHDLKAPLSSMIGFLKLVRDDSAAQFDEGAKLILTNAINSGKNMASLIDDLLNISRIRTGALKLHKQFFDAKYLGAVMVANYSYIAGQKGIEITNMIPENSRVYADRTLLTEAVQNLITNAIKFCKRGNHITISLAIEDATTICVADTGPGIEPKRLNDLFNYDVRTSTRGTEGETGSGLGLPLVNDIMELHGGQLEAKSEFGKGSQFSLKLPYVRPKILIVDDDRNFRYLQMHLLKEMNATLIEAENGEDALKMMESAQPHLVISDIKMPTMDGLELLKQLKAQPGTKVIPVIMVSGEFGMEIRDTVFKLGAEDFVTKDKIDKMDFFPRVRRFIG